MQTDLTDSLFALLDEDLKPEDTRHSVTATDRMSLPDTIDSPHYQDKYSESYIPYLEMRTDPLNPDTQFTRAFLVEYILALCHIGSSFRLGSEKSESLYGTTIVNQHQITKKLFQKSVSVGTHRPSGHDLVRMFGFDTNQTETIREMIRRFYGIDRSQFILQVGSRGDAYLATLPRMLSPQHYPFTVPPTSVPEPLVWIHSTAKHRGKVDLANANTTGDGELFMPARGCDYAPWIAMRIEKFAADSADLGFYSTLSSTAPLTAPPTTINPAASEHEKELHRRRHQALDIAEGLLICASMIPTRDKPRYDNMTLLPLAYTQAAGLVAMLASPNPIKVSSTGAKIKTKLLGSRVQVCCTPGSARSFRRRVQALRDFDRRSSDIIISTLDASSREEAIEARARLYEVLEDELCSVASARTNLVALFSEPTPEGTRSYHERTAPTLTEALGQLRLALGDMDFSY
eukprot:gnl/Dysnectes_brevis/4002_a5220_695.p1 GENE.gnl/Dysnectes_brevis/4002_a5220_695~~gnl/Dysnectes_brevis/4002_a5220_695.p1  ORF type:complete len:539 (+),score=112.33 gnl/Dysnectes_brevis/4002_a5220_695:240-1619(+)